MINDLRLPYPCRVIFYDWHEETYSSCDSKLNEDSSGIISSDVVRFEHGDVVVADNASADDSISWLEKHLPMVRIIRLNTNLGFTGGYNEALKQVDYEFYVLLNSDVRVTENWLSPMLEPIDKQPQCAAIQPKICSLNHPG